MQRLQGLLRRNKLLSIQRPQLLHISNYLDKKQIESKYHNSQTKGQVFKTGFKTLTLEALRTKAQRNKHRKVFRVWAE